MGTTVTTAKVSEPIANLATLLRELSEVMTRHNATGGFSLMFAPRQLELPEGYVLVQRFSQETGTIELVPTPIDECDLGDVLQGTQEFSLSDREFIAVAARPGRTHLCNVRYGRIHDHSTTGG